MSWPRTFVRPHFDSRRMNGIRVYRSTYNACSTQPLEDQRKIYDLVGFLLRAPNKLKLFRLLLRHNVHKSIKDKTQSDVKSPSSHCGSQINVINTEFNRFRTARTLISIYVRFVLDSCLCVHRSI